MNYIENKVWDIAFEKVFGAAFDEIKAILDEKTAKIIIAKFQSLY